MGIQASDPTECGSVARWQILAADACGEFLQTPFVRWYPLNCVFGITTCEHDLRVAVRGSLFSPD